MRGELKRNLKGTFACTCIVHIILYLICQRCGTPIIWSREHTWVRTNPDQMVQCESEYYCECARMRQVRRRLTFMNRQWSDRVRVVHEHVWRVWLWSFKLSTLALWGKSVRCGPACAQVCSHQLKRIMVTAYKFCNGGVQPIKRYGATCLCHADIQGDPFKMSQTSGVAPCKRRF